MAFSLDYTQRNNSLPLCCVSHFMLSVILLNVIMLNVSFYVEWHYAKCLILCWVALCWMSLYLMSHFMLSVIILNVILLNAIMLNVIMLNAIVLNVIVLNVTFYVECHYAECHYAECHYAECQYAECHYAECCVTIKNIAIRYVNVNPQVDKDIISWQRYRLSPTLLCIKLVCHLAYWHLADGHSTLFQLNLESILSKNVVYLPSLFCSLAHFIIVNNLCLLSETV